MININLSEEGFEPFAGFLQGKVDLMEDTLLESDDLIWDSIVSSLSGSLFVVVKLELIPLEDSKERFVVDSCLLVPPEMFYKLVYFSLINTKFHVLENVFEIISG